MVEEKTNAALEAAGIDSRVDCRSLKDQRLAALEAGDQELANSLNRLPTIHEGPRVTQIRREAAKHNRNVLGSLDRAAANDAIIGINKDRAEYYLVSAQIFIFEKAKAARDKTLEWINKAKNSIGAKKADVQRIEPRIRNRNLDRISDDDFEKYGRQFYDMPSDYSSAVKAPSPEPVSVHISAPTAVKKRRHVLDDDPSP